MHHLNPFLGVVLSVSNSVKLVNASSDRKGSVVVSDCNMTVSRVVRNGSGALGVGQTRKGRGTPTSSLSGLVRYSSNTVRQVLSLSPRDDLVVISRGNELVLSLNNLKSPDLSLGVALNQLSG